VEVTTDVLQTNERGKPSILGAQDLVATLAEFGRDPGKTEVGVDILLGRG
jgi:hypothetical protein